MHDLNIGYHPAKQLPIANQITYHHRQNPYLIKANASTSRAQKERKNHENQ
jgi:hypothetical protein